MNTYTNKSKNHKSLLIAVLLLLCMDLMAQDVVNSVMQPHALNLQPDAVPAMLTGIVTNAATGTPVIGARITLPSVPAQYTYSVSGGTYTLNIFPVGTWTATCSKAGYENFTAGPFTFQQGVTITQNFPLLESLNAPVNVVAVLNPIQTKVNITWGVPVGQYELLYEDGIQDEFAIWAQGGNLNAVKFTPVAYPAALIGGSINVGTSANYPAGNPFVPFKIIIYNATGPGGTPGTAIDTFDVVPTIGVYGWIPLPAMNIAITSGSFYIAMLQGGNPPNALGLAVDETTPQMRSYERFVLGSGPWVPANGNFMIRAIMTGTGGPVILDNNGNAAQVPPENPEILTGYQVWRLRQGQESNQSLWTYLGTTTNAYINDNSWPSLTNGPYRWAVKAIYSGNRPSLPTFSNVIGKGWTATVTVNVTLTCAAHSKEGTTVYLQNAAYPDTNYTALTDTSGTAVISNVWKGDYVMTVIRFTYPAYTQNITVMSHKTFDVVLLQDKYPPTGITVDNKSLHSEWNAPRAVLTLLTELWTSGNFTANQWTVDPGSNWSVTSAFGNPAPSAMFNWSPIQTNYSYSITSKGITGVHAPVQLFKYDIYLSSFSASTLEEFAVEIWNGSTWVMLKHYESYSNIPWTKETLDISAYTHQTFQVRFRAYGSNSYIINNWNVDNISILAADGTSGPNPCVIGYNYYLSNILSACTMDTNYSIPPNHVQYGQTYNACVKAVYGSGYSEANCTTFISKFLFPPELLEAQAIECAAYLTWHRPHLFFDISTLVVQPRTEFPDPTVDYSPQVAIRGGFEYSDALWDILFSWNCHNAAMPGIECDGQFIYTSSWQPGYSCPPWFHKFNIMTGVNVDNFDIPGATAVRDMAYDGQYFYGAAANTSLFKMDFNTHTLVQTITSAIASRHIAFDPMLDGSNGGFWCGDWNDIAAIRKNGQLLYVGPPVTSIYGDAWDNQSDYGNKNFLWTFSQTGPHSCDLTQYEIKTTAPYLVPTGVVKDAGTLPGYNAGMAGGLCAHKVNDKFALIGNIQQSPNLVFAYEIATYTGGCCSPGLIGYNIYRDDNFIHYNPHPDSLDYYDMNLDPGTYKYDVTAVYDLTLYGFPGQIDESIYSPDGPAYVTIVCCCVLPFYEPWDQGLFTYQEWTFTPGQGNWSINSATGNPAPTADFSWDPIRTNYSYSLVSTHMDASAWTCANLWLDFDYKLVDRNNTGQEFLYVDLYYNGGWHNKLELSNNGSVDWTMAHIDINSVIGKGFKIRFRAEGANSEDILHWYVDNIHVYGICNPPLNFDLVSQSHLTVNLIWNTPVCSGGGGGSIPMDFIYDDGTWEDGLRYNPGFLGWIGDKFPLDPSLSGTLVSVDVYFVDNGSGTPQIMSVEVFDAAHTSIGVSAPFSASAPDIWINVPLPSIPFTGVIYPMVKFDMLPGYAYFLACDTDGPNAPLMLGYMYDGTTWSNPSYWPGGAVFFVRGHALIPTDNGDKIPVILDPTGVKPVFGSTAGTTNLGTHESVQVPLTMTDNAEGSELMGYNIWRTDETGIPPYNQLNSSLLTDTTYTDVYPDTLSVGEFYYYVTAIYNNEADNSFLCESITSDTVFVFIGAGINEPGSGAISIYPNPATNYVTVKSDYTMSRIEVMNFTGQTVINSNVETKASKINLTTLKAGVYFVKVTTTEGIHTVKITVMR